MAESTTAARDGGGRRATWDVVFFWLLAAVFVAAVGFVLAGRLVVYPGDAAGSGLFLLSSVITSLAAILGIAFTLTLIGIQLAAQSYTPRIISLHTRSPQFVLTFGMLVLGMIYTTVVLAEYQRVGQRADHPWMDLAVVAFVFAVLQLVPFAARTIRLLSPSGIAQALLARLTPAMFSRQDVPAVHDRVGPVFDMARRAVTSRDERTLELLLAQVQVRVTALAHSERLGPAGMKLLVSALGPEFRDLGRIATDRLAVDALKLVVDCLRELVCEVGVRHQPLADELYDAAQDIWREAEVRFSDPAYASRLAELRESMAACQARVAGVVADSPNRE